MSTVTVHAWLTYRDIAGRIGLATTEAAAARVRRAKWPKRLRADTGEAEALVPLDALVPLAISPRVVKAATRRPTTADLEPLSKAMAKIPTRPCRTTGFRWLQQYPDLGMRIAGRWCIWRAAREAIARGVPLDQAAAIGRACREMQGPMGAE